MSLFINNEWCSGHGPTLNAYSPDGKILTWSAKTASDNQVDLAVSASKQANRGWQQLTTGERVSFIKQFGRLLVEHKQKLAEVINSETGKPIWEALTEVAAMVAKIDISIEAHIQRTPEHNNNNLRLNHRPHGSFIVFGPYNFPGHLPNGHIVPALIAGNTVLFKPSELTPKTGEFVMQLWQQTGIPKGVMQLLQGGIAVGKKLVEADIDGILFTGSSTVGFDIHRQLAGRPEVMLALEMGGNNGLILSPNTQPESAAKIIFQSAFLSGGQRCTCARRLIVIDGAKSDATIEALLKLCDQALVGEHIEQPAYGPVIHLKAADTVRKKIAMLSDNGAKIIRNTNSTGVHLTPAIVDVSEVTTRQDDEVFGPLLQIIRVTSFEQAMIELNSTKYGLAAGLISEDVLEQKQFWAQAHAGVCSINAPTAGAASNLPFGGVGASGNHRPSAYYAADYCAWPQAGRHNPKIALPEAIAITGIKA